MNRPHDSKRPTWIFLAILGWGAMLSAWVVRGFFAHSEGYIHTTHEGHNYVYRLIEFRETLTAGYLSPQWCTHFRSGLGSPYFSYYQPGFFYVGSLTWLLDPVCGLGVTLWMFSMAGYLGLVALMQRVFDLISAWLSGSLLLLSVYAGSELYVRGALSEYAGMMLVPPTFFALIVCLETGRALPVAFCIALFAGLVITHPCVALPTCGFLCLVAVAHTVSTRRWRNGVVTMVALVLGGALAAFYWMPIVREMDLVQGENAISGYYHYTKNFIQPLWLLETYSRESTIPYTVGLSAMVLIPINTIVLYLRWQKLTDEQRRLVRTFAAVALFCFILMTSVSKPLWDICPPLQRLQFPWRLLTLFTMCIAGLGGLVLLGFQSRTRLIAGFGVVSLSWYCSIDYTHRNPAFAFRPVSHASEIADVEYFAPDLADEFFPRHARKELSGGVPRLPSGSDGIVISEFQREIGQLSCFVKASEPGYVVLPHYFFAGWQAKLNDETIELGSNQDGLMQVTLSPNDTGHLELRFSSTPAKKIGWTVTAISALAAVFFLASLVRLQRQSSAASSFPVRDDS